MNTRTFSIETALGFRWDVMKANTGFFIGVTLLLFLVTYIPIGMGSCSSNGSRRSSGCSILWA